MIEFKAFKKRQYYVFFGILVCLLVIGLVFWAISNRDAPIKPKQTYKGSMTTGASRINPQEAWVYEFRNEAELAKKRLTAMEEMLNKLMKLNQTPKPGGESYSSFDYPAASAVDGGSRDGVSQAVANIRQDLQTQASLSQQQSGEQSSQAGQKETPQFAISTSGQVLPPPPPTTPHSGVNTVGTLPSGSLAAMNPKGSFRSKTVRKITLALRNARSSTPLKSVDNTIPAGAFAKAILLGGVDASASIQASSDPRPALLRLMDAGTLPRRFHSDLKGCHALAACYGDISSERVFMRLEKLTCTERKTGEIIEVKVQGYVAGEDGRTGVRGTVVDRAGESMRNAMMGGFLGGIGEFLGQSKSTITFSPVAGLAQSGGLTQVNPMSMGEMLKAGAGKGVNNALEKYADFYIKRAEQVQPVIQVAAGRQVDIVFTEGVSINDSVYRQALGHSHDQERYHQIQGIQEKSSPSITDWTDSSGTGASRYNSQESSAIHDSGDNK